MTLWLNCQGDLTHASQLSVGLFSHEAVITNHLPDNRSILLLHKTLVIFHLRTSSCEGQMFLFTIGHHDLIDELPSIIRINSQDRKREQAPCVLDRCQNCLLALIEERKTFGPPRCHIREGQGPEKTSRKACPSVRATM